MSSPELDGLIVEHLADLDRAAARIDGIEAAVFTAMGEKAGVWAKKQGWVSDFDWPEDGWDAWPAWVAPQGWRTADTSTADDTFDGSFVLSVGGGDTEVGKAGEDWFYLTRLCRVGVGQLGLRFARPSFVKPRQWKQALPRLAELVRNTRLVVDEEPSFFLPFKIEAVALAQALREEDPNAALGPFEAALDSLLDAKPAFDQVLQHLRSLGS